jgi:hypothetical protein
MTVYDLDLDGDTAELPAGVHRFLYVSDGQVSIATADTKIELPTDEGMFSQGLTHITGAGTIWVYEVGPDKSPSLDDPLRSIVLSRRFTLEFSPPWLLRADRIESNPGSATPRHGHRGPGMRRLIKGCLLAQIGDDFDRIDKGHAWFETGKDPVIGTNIHTDTSAFVRVMLLPIELEGGKSSFVPTTAEDASKPRAVKQRLFGEVVIEAEPNGLVHR